MRIFIFSTVFAPSIGGIERVVEVLAQEFVAMGHEVRVATLTPGPVPGDWPFEVVRRPSMLSFLGLLRWCDVHLQANLSLKHLHPIATQTPFVVHHGNVYGGECPQRQWREAIKAKIARHISGVACSRYVGLSLECKQVIPNPYDSETFRRHHPTATRDLDVAFLGRLVSEKGCDTLISALALLASRACSPSCTIIGDGPERAALEAQVMNSGLGRTVRLAGALQGKKLADTLGRHRILVVPSRYREPFGIVALEGLACGCLPIVSRDGGLVEAIGPHGLTFRNGDVTDLADALERALYEPGLVPGLLEGSEAHLSAFRARTVAESYIEVFNTTMRRHF